MGAHFEREEEKGGEWKGRVGGTETQTREVKTHTEQKCWCKNVSERLLEIWRACGWGHGKQRSVCLKWGLTGLSLAPPPLYEHTHTQPHTNTHTQLHLSLTRPSRKGRGFWHQSRLHFKRDRHGDAGHSVTSTLGAIQRSQTAEVSSRLCLVHGYVTAAGRNRSAH